MGVGTYHEVARHHNAQLGQKGMLDAHAALLEVVSDASAGASGFLLKDVTSAELADAVRAVASGDAVLTPRITRKVPAGAFFDSSAFISFINFIARAFAIFSAGTGTGR